MRRRASLWNEAAAIEDNGGAISAQTANGETINACHEKDGRSVSGCNEKAAQNGRAANYGGH